MGLWVVLHCWVLSLLFFRAHGDGGSEVSVKFLKAPRAFSRLNSANFSFQILVGGNETCSDCTVSCKLDGGTPSDCGSWEILYTNLKDGNHSFEVCGNGSQGFSCSTQNWIVDTIPPTAYVTTPSSFTNAQNVSINIFFSEPCTGGGGFQCSSVNACKLLVYGAGQVIPSSLITLQPNLRYSLLVGLSSTVQFGRIIMVMDKNFCSDTAGNMFTRTENSTFYLHFDRRSVYVDLRTRVPEKLLRLDNQTRTVQATNNNENLRVYLYFSQPVLNSSSEILNSLSTSKGILVPIDGESLLNRRFGFTVANISSTAIITISLNSESIISRFGTPVSPINPVTLLYDSQRPAVRLSTTSSMRTRQHNLPIYIKFLKPVFGFNASSISISGGLLWSFQEISRNMFFMEIQADGSTVSIDVPENVTRDVAGNKNLPSNVLQVTHYSVPVISYVISTFVTVAFLTTSFAAAFLTVSSASLLSSGAYSRPSSIIADPARNLFRTACYIQVFALSRWLAVTLPVEYYELARGIQWSIPYLNLPWETKHPKQVIGSGGPHSPYSYISKFHSLENFRSKLPEKPNLIKAAPVYGLPLTPMEYSLYFENPDMKPEAEYLDLTHPNGWRDFYRSMFWLAVIAGSLLLLHALVLVILKFKRRSSEKKRGYGAITFPRFEMFLLVLALPCICKAAAVLVRGGETAGAIVGILLLCMVSFQLLSFLSFLSVGITCGKLLQYKEIHQVGQKFHWYQELIRVTLGPGKRGQWTWKDQPNSIYITILGPLFEDLRGPPKYMLSQIAGGGNRPRKHNDRLIASDDENEDAEAPFIQKVFGILRIYYTLLETIKRVCLGILAGAYSNDWTKRAPTVILLGITSFQLFFMVLKKPFIKKKVQLVEIISLSCQVGIFASCLVLMKKEFSSSEESRLGIFMLLLFLIGFLAQIINEWCALYRQIKMLDFSKNSFLTGLKIALCGFLLLILPRKLLQTFESKFPLDQHGALENGDFSSSADQNRTSGSRSSGSTDKPWLKQLRELAKSSFTKEGSGGSRNVASTTRGKWSGYWGMKSSGSSSMSSSSDLKAKPGGSKPRGLYKDLEAIFASK